MGCNHYLHVHKQISSDHVTHLKQVFFIKVMVTLILAIKDGLRHHFSDPRYGCIFWYSIVDRYNSQFKLNHECITLLNSI